ncbi:MAG: hypothetical protein CTR53_10410 [Ferrovibrio sp.]|nr:MAG: hypothetical protein CTR53_10410 [Ferrovibrio sp.]
MQLANNAQVANAANGLGESLFQDSEKADLQRQALLGSTLGTFAGQDANTAAQQAALNNSFNQIMLQLQTGANKYGADMQNQASLYNLGNQDAIDRANVDIANKNLDRYNQFQDKNFTNSGQLASANANALNAIQSAIDTREMAGDQFNMDLAKLGLQGAGLLFGKDGFGLKGSDIADVAGTVGSAAMDAGSWLGDTIGSIFDWF